MVIIALKQSLIKSWRDLKNEKLDDVKRKAAFADIVNVSDSISKIDAKFRMNVEMLEKYKDFKSATIVPRVVWPELKASYKGLEKLEQDFDEITALAVSITKKRLPREPQDSQLFGMIVSATSDKLIALLNGKGSYNRK